MLTAKQSVIDARKRLNPNKIPDDILNNAELNRAIEILLPQNYNFEIHKTIARIRLLNAHRVALQLPEGLCLFAAVISDILTRFTYDDDSLDVLIMGDVAYGACCIDDFTSRALGCDLLVHYGHSCLVQLDVTKTFYVFVDIKFDTKHFIDTVLANFEPGKHLAMVATIQFITTLQAVKQELLKTFTITIPKISPLSPGEILGCTAPSVTDADLILYVADGRFHLESMMMANPTLPAYRYDPYTKVITKEYYDHELMRKNRFNEIRKAKSAKTFGVIMGTLGRQGSETVLKTVIKNIKKRNLEYVIILLSEVFPSKLQMFGDSIDAFVQISCPRLSIDWGTYFTKPLLTPYEVAVALDMVEWLPGGKYPTDFYAYDSLGKWTPNYKPGKVTQKRHIKIGEEKSKEVIQVIINAEENPTISCSKTVTESCCKDHGVESCSNCSCMFN